MGEMKRTLVIAVLAALLLASIGTTAVTAAKPRDAYWPGKSVYLFDVTSTSDPNGWGKLLINLNEQQFVFFGLGFLPGQKYLLAYSQASTGGEPMPLITVADAAANKFGVIYIKGEWTHALDPSTAEFTVNVIVQAGSGPLHAILTADPGTQETVNGVPGQWYYLKANASTGDIVRYYLVVQLAKPGQLAQGTLYDGSDPHLGNGEQGYPYFLPDVRVETYTIKLTVYDSAGASNTASIVWNPSA
jgi:hypothetical protein